MTIKIKQTVEKDIEVSLPLFKKSKYEVVKICAGPRENCCTVETVWLLDDSFSHSKRTQYSIEEYFMDEKFGPATEEDFEQQMSAMAALMSDNTESKAA